MGFTLLIAANSLLSPFEYSEIETGIERDKIPGM